MNNIGLQYSDFSDYRIFKNGKVFSIKKNIIMRTEKTKNGYHRVTISKKQKEF